NAVNIDGQAALVGGSDAGLDGHARGDALPVGLDGGALAGEEEHAVGPVETLNVDLDLGAQRREALGELQQGEHALGAAAGQVDEDVGPVDAEDLALLGALFGRLAATLLLGLAVEVLVRQAAHRFLQLAL